VSGISTHVLDNSRGRPGSGVAVTLEFRTATGWEIQGRGTTDDNGRIDHLLSEEEELVKGTYRVTFDTGSYYRLKGQESFYPQVVVVFEVARTDEHYHIPLLLNRFGYTTYRGN
jgi:5-hydroxyisourate hydrolase